MIKIFGGLDMKPICAFLFVLFVPAIHAQTLPVIHAPTLRSGPLAAGSVGGTSAGSVESGGAAADAKPEFLIGIQVGRSVGNAWFGGSASAALPFGHRFEALIGESFSPLEAHFPYGTGWSASTTAGGVAWLNDKWGIIGDLQYSAYSVTALRKASWYWQSGPAYSLNFFGYPTEISMLYTQQFRNGINAATGVETSHFKGAVVSLSSRIGCAGVACFIWTLQVNGGHVLNQGNPICDGTFGNGSQARLSPCPRSASSSGGVAASISLELPRRR